MALNFKEIGQKATNDSELMATRQKVKCKEVINRFPNGITINAVDFVNMTDKKTKEDKSVAVFGFAEDPTKYFFGGIQLNKIAAAWLEAASGSVSDLNAELASGCKVKLFEDETSDGTTFVNVEFI